MDKYYYYIVGTLIAAAVTIIPKVLPLFFLKGKTFNRKLMTFFKIIPYTSMTVLILREVLTANASDKLMYSVTIAVTSVVSYISRNMILTVFASILTTFLYINFLI